MHRRITSALAAAALAAGGLTAAFAAQATAGEPAPRDTSARPTEWREIYSPDGHIDKVRVPKQEKRQLTTADRKKAAAAAVVPIQETGPSADRFDMVIVGDGYTAGEADAQRAHAEQQWAEISGTEPWAKYKDRINVWLVETVSADSGVDNDPTQGVARDTALDMGFFCSGIERLLCLDEGKAQEYAAQAPEADAILAVGNTTKYGGAGYTTLATVAGGNEQASRIAIHELGHSVGGLQDEYWSEGTQWPGGEPDAVNVTTDPSGAKWQQYLGKETPDGGVIGAFEGGAQYSNGIYRPSENSLMRSLDKPFNLIGLDAMDKAISSKISAAEQGADTR